MSTGLPRAIFMGGQTAGQVGLITAMAVLDIQCVVSVDHALVDLAARLGLPSVPFLHSPGVQDAKADLLVSVHGREIVPDAMLKSLAFGGINVHPMWSWFKGADPVGRWLQSDRASASVAAHAMTAKVDEGPRICEAFITIDHGDGTTREDVYRQLYRLYAFVLRRALDPILSVYFGGVWNPYSPTPTPPFVEWVLP